MTRGPQRGVTVRAHVEGLIVDAWSTLHGHLMTVRTTKRLRPAQREDMRRELAGVIADCETVRLWLDAGAPDVTFKGTA